MGRRRHRRGDASTPLDHGSWWCAYRSRGRICCRENLFANRIPAGNVASEIRGRSSDSTSSARASMTLWSFGVDGGLGQRPEHLAVSVIERRGSPIWRPEPSSGSMQKRVMASFRKRAVRMCSSTTPRSRWRDTVRSKRARRLNSRCRRGKKVCRPPTSARRNAQQLRAGRGARFRFATRHVRC